MVFTQRIVVIHKYVHVAMVDNSWNVSMQSNTLGKEIFQRYLYSGFGCQAEGLAIQYYITYLLFEEHHTNYCMTKTIQIMLKTST